MNQKERDEIRKQLEGALDAPALVDKLTKTLDALDMIASVSWTTEDAAEYCLWVQEYLGVGKWG